MLNSSRNKDLLLLLSVTSQPADIDPLQAPILHYQSLKTSAFCWC